VLLCWAACRLEYAYEKRESFVKHVLENVDAIGREAPSNGEADPFAVLGLSRGASAQQVRGSPTCSPQRGCTQAAQRRGGSGQ
jgi:hypothetical protein